MRRSVLVLALTLVLGTGVHPATATGSASLGATSSSSDEPTVVSLSLAPLQVTTSGVATAPVTVEFAFRQTSTDPIPPTPSRVVLRPVSPSRPLAIPPILSIVTPQVSGTATDGVWRGTIPVPSSAAGLWRVECVMLPSGGAAPARCLVPPQRPTLRVIGTHLPLLTVTVHPHPIRLSGSTTVSARLVDSRTGRGFASREIVVATRWQTCVFEGTCSGEGLYGASSDAQGRSTVSISTGQAPRLCVVATIPGTHPADPDAPTLATDCRSIRHVVHLTAGAATSRVRIDRAVTVSGRVLPAPRTGHTSMAAGRVIQLQRLTHGVWRTVGSAAVATDGTYRLSARADARGGTRGIQRYRVVLNQSVRTTKAISAPLRITAV